MATGAKKRKIFDDRYEILSIVGRGSRSVVYRAQRIRGEKEEIALKVLVSKKNETSATVQLRKEALAMVSARHKYVIRLDDFHSVGDLCYLAMEYAAEADLRQYVKKQGGKLRSNQAELFLLQIGDALNFLHQAGLLHRDIKPDNILVIDHQNVRIADFGVATLPGESSSLEELKSGVGTMNYMPPELLDGRGFDHRSDIYALALTLYEMLAGFNPFEKAPLIDQLKIRENGNFPDLKELAPKAPGYLSNAIMRALSYDPEQRFQSAREFIHYLLDEKSKERAAKKQQSSASAADGATPKPTYQPKPLIAKRKLTEKQDNKDLSKDKKPQKPLGEDKKDKIKQKTEPLSKEKEQALKVAESGHEKRPDKEKETKETGAESEAHQPKARPKTKRKRRRKKKRTNSAEEQKDQASQARQGKEEHGPGKSLTADQQKEEKSNFPKEKETETSERADYPFAKVLKEQSSAKKLEAMAEQNQPQRKVEDKSQEESALQSRPRRLSEARSQDKHTENVSRNAQVRTRENLTSIAAIAKRIISRHPKVFIILGLIIAFMIFFPGHSDTPETPENSSLSQLLDGVSEENSQNINLLPVSADATLSFPNLAPGTYMGWFENLIPGETTLCTVLVYPDRDEMVIMMALSGWQPATIAIPADDETISKQTLQLATNAMILEMKLKSDDNGLAGEFVNFVNGAQGQWYLSPVG